MKRLLFMSAIILLICQQAIAAGTVVISTSKHGADVKTITFTCIGDSADGSIPNTSTDDKTYGRDNVTLTNLIEGWYLDKVEIDPGTTAPTPDSDVYVINGADIDLLGGNGVDKLHSSTSLACVPSTNSQNKQQPIDGALILDVDNQSVNSATYVVKYYLSR